jgi:hypothetical protein
VHAIESARVVLRYGSPEEIERKGVMNALG